MKRNVLAYLGQQIFVEEKRTLDLLQGLLVCIAWAHTCQISDEQVTNLTHLALGYAHNLGITKIPAAHPRIVDSKDASKEKTKTANTDTIERTHSSEEQRAFLGCFCTLSITSFQASRRDPLSGPYVDVSRDALSDMSTSRTDLLLNGIVHIVQMSDKLSKGFGEPHERDQARSYAFLLEGSGRRFRTQLDRLAENTAHPDIAEHRSFFELYHQYLIVRLYEPAVTVAERPEEGVPPSMYRSLCLRNCLGAAQEFLELLLAQPIDTYLRHSIINTGQAAFVMFMTARLLLIDTPDWDVALARQTLDLRTTLDQIFAHVTEAEELRVRTMEEFAVETGYVVTDEERKSGSRLVEMAQKTRWLREWFDARLQGRPMQEHWPFPADGMGGMAKEAGDKGVAPSCEGATLVEAYSYSSWGI
ncbi:hypothetical protein G7Z17_g5647 [Cylindrodendrum hubeiense]|uniref:Uncharacterized protein n=1 Tax=Cylindrodendrum hubeiense TaxID=595255 RepID=A0A9P5H6R2_9HYPO|nr:hypothetical protein G7Z17_g5647 [Cylindrodendrum hubeiense]